jgi:hypothetical protein
MNGRDASSFSLLESRAVQHRKIIVLIFCTVYNIICDRPGAVSESRAERIYVFGPCRRGSLRIQEPADCVGGQRTVLAPDHLLCWGQRTVLAPDHLLGLSVKRRGAFKVQSERAFPSSTVLSQLRGLESGGLVWRGIVTRTHAPSLWSILVQLYDIDHLRRLLDRASRTWSRRKGFDHRV